MKKIIYSTLTLIFGLVLSSAGCNTDGTDPDVYDVGVKIGNVTWATRNVGEFGKFAATPEDHGMFYQWNRAKEWPTTDPYTGTWPSAGYMDPKWEVGNNPCPDGWRIPTKDELQGLTAVAQPWDGDYSKRKYGSGTNYIILPAVGSRRYDGVLAGGSGRYWSNTSNDVEPSYANIFAMDSGAGGNIVFWDKNAGMSVRCVKGPK